MGIQYYLDSMKYLQTIIPHISPREKRGRQLSEKDEEEIRTLLSRVSCAPPSLVHGYSDFSQMLVKSGPCYKTDDQVLYDSTVPDEEKLATATFVLRKTPSLLHATPVTPSVGGPVVIHVHEKEQGLRIFPDDFAYKHQLEEEYDRAISRTTGIIDKCSLMRGGDPRKIIPLVIEEQYPAWEIAERLAKEFVDEDPSLLKHPLMKKDRAVSFQDFRLDGRLSVDILNTPEYLREISVYLSQHPDYLKKLCIPPDAKVGTTTRRIWKYYGMDDSSAEKYLTDQVIPELTRTPVAIEPTRYMYGDPFHSVLSFPIKRAYSSGELGFVSLHVPHGIPKIEERMRKTRYDLKTERVVKPIIDMNKTGGIYLGDVEGTERILEELYQDGIFSVPPSLNPGLQWLLVSGVPQLMGEAVETIRGYERRTKIDGSKVYGLVSGYLHGLISIDD